MPQLLIGVLCLFPGLETDGCFQGFAQLGIFAGHSQIEVGHVICRHAVNEAGVVLRFFCFLGGSYVLIVGVDFPFHLGYEAL